MGVFVDDWPKLLAAAREAAQKAELIRCTQGVEYAGDALARLEEELERLQPALANLAKEVTL
jgi:hypothetical protein